MSGKLKKHWWQKRYGLNVWITTIITVTACLLPLFKFGIIDDIIDSDTWFIDNISLLLAVWTYTYIILSAFHSQEEIYGDEWKPFSWRLVARQIIMFPVILLPGIVVVFVSYYIYMLFLTIIQFTVGLLFLPFW